MADDFGLTLDDYIVDLMITQNNNYAQVAAMSLLAYDTIYLFPQEVGQRFSTALRSMVRFTSPKAVSVFGDRSFRIRCITQYSTINFFTETLIPITMKVLLILRLRAAWNNNRIVSIVLYVLTAAEALTGLCALIFSIYYTIISSIGGVPLHACWGSLADSNLNEILFQVSGSFVGARAVSTLIETCLTLAKFIMMYRELKGSGSNLRERISHIQVFTPLLYVFYRDGLLLFIPILCRVLPLLFLVVDLTFRIPSVINCDDNLGLQSRSSNNGWDNLRKHQLVNAPRLILNVREAGSSFGQSLLTKPIQSMHFRHTTQNSDTEDSAFEGTYDIREEART
ncbi:hypothetical protein NP233_g3741 [Leucocoprinus birnbaumii]|uniref:Uncharacterized protein n=1 Tax=Leucocoprinus birnbaumii TaxID=56174 RepID=A0AAD5YY48_9AGAR|nr:hypothetical protein NP233_g3741 [Leucocoprinus birnbaumii]